MPDKHYRLQLLGGIDLHERGGSSVDRLLVQPKRLALLVVLALEPARFVRRTSLLALFWPDSTESSARGALRGAVHHLRASLGGDVVVSRGRHEIGLLPGRIRCDASVFLRAMENERWHTAAEIYEGPLLPGFTVPGHPELARWFDERRDEFKWAAGRAFRQAAEVQEERGDLERAAYFARGAERVAPFDERTVRTALRIYHGMGEPGQALAAYRRYRDRLDEELGVDPSPEIDELLVRLGYPVPPPGE